MKNKIEKIQMNIEKIIIEIGGIIYGCNRNK